MDFELSAEQRDLQEGIRSLLNGRLPLAATREREGQRSAVDPSSWDELRDAGVFSLMVPEAEGGVGLGLAEAAVVFEELGRVLAPGPLVGTCALAPYVSAAAEGQPHGLIERRSAGGAIPLIIENAESAVAFGTLPPVDDVVSPVELVTRTSLDLGEVTTPLDPLTPLSLLRGALPEGTSLDGISNHRVRQIAMVLTAAFQVGIAAQVVDIATEYAKGREQFGRPIGGFQAIKHLLADALCRAELARCAVQAAAVTLDDAHVAAGEADTMGLSIEQVAWRAVAGAKMLADEAAITNSRTAIQVHGGMGFTWEVPVHLYLKRARVLASSLGTRTELADMLASLI